MKNQFSWAIFMALSFITFFVRAQDCSNTPIVIEYQINDDNNWIQSTPINLSTGDKIQLGVDAYYQTGDMSIATPNRGTQANYHQFLNMTVADAGVYTFEHTPTGCTNTIQILVDGEDGSGGGTTPPSGDGQWISNASNIYYNTGNVGIGTTDPGASWKLAVNGNIRAKEIKVETGWADYVFEPGYDLPSLKEVEIYINEHGHLINIPSAKEVSQNGIQIGNMNRLLLEKIEELTLYIIQQQKEIDSLKKSIE